MGASQKITTELYWPGIQTKYATFLGSTYQEAPIGSSQVLPSLTSLTGHSVSLVFMSEEKKENFFKNTKVETTSVFSALWFTYNQTKCTAWQHCIMIG